MNNMRALPMAPEESVALESGSWFAPGSGANAGEDLGFRHGPGGVHLSKTMMLAELTAVMNACSNREPATVERLVLRDNVLGKNTGKARRQALSNLNYLYGVLSPKPVQKAFLKLWRRNTAGRPVLAILCALAREPLLRESAAIILGVRPGAPVGWPEMAAVITERFPGRYSPKTARSLAQSCASSWTQSGHLRGRVKKVRSTAEPSAEAAAYAALLGTIAGFGGPALLASPWMTLLDRSESDILLLLRRAESAGLARIRAGGGVLQINVRLPMAEMLKVPELGHG